MVNNIWTLRHVLIGGLAAAAMSACAPSYQMQGYDASMDAGYSQSAYGYESAGYEAQAHHMTQMTTATHRSRYGGELRGGCDVEIDPCGMMAVVPVYPVYQYVIAPPTPEVPVVEVPQIVEPDPIPYVEPTPYVEPVYEPPVQHWPEPEVPAPTWTPLRK